MSDILIFNMQYVLKPFSFSRAFINNRQNHNVVFHIFGYDDKVDLEADTKVEALEERAKPVETIERAVAFEPNLNWEQILEELTKYLETFKLEKAQAEKQKEQDEFDDNFEEVKEKLSGVTIK